MLEEHGSWEMISCLQEEDDSYIFKRLCLNKMFSLMLNLTTAPQVVEGENNIFVPKNGEWVDATTERFIYQVGQLLGEHTRTLFLMIINFRKNRISM